ncbi:MAG: hypothetical protein NTW86_29505 [Candidatus Sumerlaeota bacterium]|nr:hypothetical protein [Candidatus Sumerlaeota bacterium]
MKHRVFLAALALATLPIRPASAASGSVAGALQEAQVQQKKEGESGARRVFPYKRKIVEFLQPPVSPEQPAIIPPPLVTFRSDPQLRAQYPPNPHAATVSEAFRQTFGKLVQFNYTLHGPDEQLLIRQAIRSALLSLAGRVYFLDRILLACDMLPKYFEQNGDRFVRQVHVTNRTLEGGLPKFDLQLIVDEDLVLKDLEEKRFLYRPKYRPFFFLFLEQVVNGAPDSEQERGRKAMENVLRDRTMRLAESTLPSMLNKDIDISVDEQTFLEGRQAAQKNEVEVALSGSLIARGADLEATLSEEDWAQHGLRVTVQSDTLSSPVVARLPIADLLKKLDESLEARKSAGEREWWDVGSIEVEAPVETLLVSDGEKSALQASAPFKALIPVARIGMKRNYYQPMYYASARLSLKLIRVDNGEILGETFEAATASDADRERAIQLAIEEVVNKATNTLIDVYNAVWAKVMLDKADYRIMITRTTERAAEDLAGLLEGMDLGIKVYFRGFLGDVAVLTLNFSGDRQQLVDLLTQLDHPRFHVVKSEDKTLTVEQI